MLRLRYVLFFNFPSSVVNGEIKEIFSEAGWSIRRVSLKPRNKSNAVPDAFERKVLNKFNQLQTKGEPFSLLEYSEIGIKSDIRTAESALSRCYVLDSIIPKRVSKP